MSYETKKEETQMLQVLALELKVQEEDNMRFFWIPKGVPEVKSVIKNGIPKVKNL